MEPENNITYFAETDFRNQKKRFGIKQADRSRHMYVIGKTGMGKSTLLKNMAIQDIEAGNGMAFLDPHGELVEELLDYIPEHRIDDVLYFAPFDLTHPISFNVMEDVGYERRHLVANGLMSAFKKIWVDVWSARMEYILNNTLLALLEYPDSTLLGVNRMLSDKVYRKRVVANISDVAVRAFWEDEFASYSERYMQEAGSAIQNKIGQFISNPLIRNIIGQSKSSFDVRDLMDNKKILLINLSKGKVGEDNANLLGSMLITKIYLAAMSRSDVSLYDLKKLPQFYFYVDEFQSFANESFANILSEARKYKLSLTIAHQYIEQMTDEVRAAVFGNVGTMLSFRVGATDAEVLEREFAPAFEAADIVNLGFAQIYLRLMIDGVGSKPFSATTLRPFPHPSQSFADLVIRRSRDNYALKRSEVEEQLAIWHESHGGLLDDPNVINKRNKEIEKKEAHINAYQESRTNIPVSEEDISIPKPNSQPSPSLIRAESGSDPDLNQRLQKAIAKTQVFHEENKSKDVKKVKKKAKSKESISDLRSTLADVLKDAGISVPKESKSKKTDDTNDEKNKDEVSNESSKSKTVGNMVDKIANNDSDIKDKLEKKGDSEKVNKKDEEQVKSNKKINPEVDLSNENIRDEKNKENRSPDIGKQDKKLKNPNPLKENNPAPAKQQEESLEARQEPKQDIKYNPPSVSYEIPEDELRALLDI